MKETIYTHLLPVIAQAKLRLDNMPNATTGSENAVLTGVLNAAYAAAGIVAVIVIIIAGIFYSMSRGNPEQIKKAKNAIIYAVVGLVFVMSAFAITWFVSNSVS